MIDADTIPVTVVSGYLGAGKTTLVNRLLEKPGDRQLAVIVNDVGEVNIDAELIAREHDDDGVIELTNGCICCRLQGDLHSEARRLVEKRQVDCLVVEASGVSEPIPVAKVFLDTEDSSGIADESAGNDDDSEPTAPFELDTMVTVLDTYGFWKAFDEDESLPGGTESAPERPLTEVFVDDIEFCDVLLCNKVDMVPDDALDEIEAVVDELQPRAERIRTTYCDVDPDLVLETGRFDFDEAKRSQGWKRHLREAAGEHDAAEAHDHDHVESHEHDHTEAHDHDHIRPTPAERHGVSTFVFRSDRPFHPDRLAEWLDDWDESIVRAKGFCYVAGRESVIGVSQAGPSVQAGPIGEWGPDDDRETRLVVIGRGMDEDRIRRTLEDCLLDAVDESTAADLADPFPIG